MKYKKVPSISNKADPVIGISDRTFIYEVNHRKRKISTCSRTRGRLSFKEQRIFSKSVLYSKDMIEDKADMLGLPPYLFNCCNREIDTISEYNRRNLTTHRSISQFNN